MHDEALLGRSRVCSEACLEVGQEGSNVQPPGKTTLVEHKLVLCIIKLSKPPAGRKGCKELPGRVTSIGGRNVYNAPTKHFARRNSGRPGVRTRGRRPWPQFSPLRDND